MVLQWYLPAVRVAQVSRPVQPCRDVHAQIITEHQWAGHSGSRLFFKTFSCSLLSVKCSLWTCSYLWGEHGATAEPSNSGVLWQTPTKPPTHGLWVLTPTSGILFYTVWAETCTGVADSRSFSKALAVLRLFLLGGVWGVGKGMNY